MPNDNPRPTAADFHPGVLELFDRYVHGAIDRRGFLEGAARYAVGGVTAAGLLQALSPDFAHAQQVPRTDPRIRAASVEFPSPQGHGTGKGMLVRPVSAPPPGGPGTATRGLPLVLVIHENRGLNPYIEDVARRLAIEDFIAFAPDALAPLGGYPGDEDQARQRFGQLDPAKTLADFLAAARYLEGVPGGNGKVGAIGFCWGGAMVHQLATRLPDLAAGVPFYGRAPAPEEAGRVKAPLLLMFAETDPGVNATWPPYEAALKSAGVRYEAYLYPGTQHGFHNDTTPRYDAGAARQAWQRTLAFLNRHVRG
ncbi:MAG TPA: dienelactone hydrolase family protein [Caldimonas sp.]|jgi:carboxymethylenebutenolidase|nr:dienelactone hydrolase family protein [Caldimonas sp.]HEX2540415.1 dienelactone hydrolase family protein [Caldimonas sp.]